MKILLSMPNDGQSNNYIINAIQALGHDIFFVDHRVHMKECLENLPAAMQEFQPDMFLCLYLVDGKTYPKKYVDFLKSQFPSVKYCAWCFDTTVNNLTYCDQDDVLIDLLKSYDCFFTVARGQVENLRSKGVNAFFVPEGFDISLGRYHPMQIKPYRYDVCFMGQVGQKSVHTERLPLLNKVAENFDNCCFYGPLYQLGNPIDKFHKKRPTYNDTEHNYACSHSKINIGHSGWPHIDGYFSARNYRILGAGGFLLANHSKNIEEFFIPNKEIVLYDSINDCIDKIRYYLKNDNERIEIAINGQERVLKEYKFSDSIQKIIKIIGEE